MRKEIEFQLISPEKAPMDLLLEADPSEEAILKYLPTSQCYLAKIEDKTIGIFVLKENTNRTWELMNIAVKTNFQKKGFGSKLLQKAIETAKENGAKKLEVGTGTFGYQLAFYQKVGFRVTSIDKDFFLKNYTEPIFEFGIQHKDMLRLTIEF